MAKNNQVSMMQNDNREGAFDFPKADSIVNTKVESQAIVIKSTSSIKKSDLARDVFNDCYKNYHVDPKSVPQRKDIINRLIKECGLTQNGAATYLQNMKKAAGLVESKK